MSRPAVQTSWPTAPCQRCRQPVIWAVGTTGMYVALDPQPRSDGTIALKAPSLGSSPSAYQPTPKLAFGLRLYRRHPEDCVPPDPLRPPARLRPGSKPAVARHLFDPYDAADLPPDHLGRLVCRTCQAPGRPGDQRHPADLRPPALPEQLREQAAARDAAVLGERDPLEER